MDNETAEEIFKLIKPYYKGLYHTYDGVPEFRRTLKPAEIENLLIGLHEIIVGLTRNAKVA